jgi:hypothetical protein
VLPERHLLERGEIWPHDGRGSLDLHALTELEHVLHPPTDPRTSDDVGTVTGDTRTSGARGEDRRDKRAISGDA